MAHPFLGKHLYVPGPISHIDMCGVLNCGASQFATIHELPVPAPLGGQVPSRPRPSAKRRAIVVVTLEVLEQALGLPRGAILDIEPPKWDRNSATEFRVKISTPDCPQVPEGMPIPQVTLPLVPGTYE